VFPLRILAGFATANVRFVTASAILVERQTDPMPPRPQHSRDNAEMLAVQAFAFIAEDEARLAGFFASSGVAVQSIREAAREPDFLAGVLDHMLGDESLLVAFADHAGLDPAHIARARQALGKVWERDLP
jgi:hypothetical protein